MREVSAVFWQYLAAAELPARKAQAIIEALERTPLDPVAYLLSAPELSEAERVRMRNADMASMEKALAGGATCLVPPPYVADNPSDFPPVLFSWGNPSAWRLPRVAIVGTRSATAYGIAVARKFSECFARAGAAVVSGGAAGIDSAAHEGALDGQGATIAVLGCGADRAYPAQNVGLYQRIRERGLIVSQFAFGARAKDYSFRVRNEIVAALSNVVVVVEAPEKSGALHTAQIAVEQNKPVLVVPGNITMFSFRGSHALIRDGATLVDHPDQVLELLHLEAAPEEEAALEGPKAQIAAALAEAPCSAEKLAELTGLELGSLLAELTELEMDGRVLRVGLGYAWKP